MSNNSNDTLNKSGEITELESQITPNRINVCKKLKSLYSKMKKQGYSQDMFLEHCKEMYGYTKNEVFDYIRVADARDLWRFNFPFSSMILLARIPFEARKRFMKDIERYKPQLGYARLKVEIEDYGRQNNCIVEMKNNNLDEAA